MFEDIDKALFEGEQHTNKEEEEVKKFEMVVVEPSERKTGVEEITTDQDVKDDYSTVRDSLHNTLKQSQEVMRSMVQFLNDAPSARGYEVMANMIKTNTEVAAQLMMLQKEISDLTKADKKATQQADTINNYQVNVSTSQLLDIIAEQENNT